MLKNGLLTVYSPRFSVVSSFLFSDSKDGVNHRNFTLLRDMFCLFWGEDEGTTKMRMEKRSYEFHSNKIKHAQLNLRKQSKVDRSTTYSSGSGEVDSWMNLSSVSEYFEYDSDAYGSIDIEIDIF
jgi:hypothetical protein